MHLKKYIRSSVGLSIILFATILLHSSPITAKEKPAQKDFTVIIDPGHGGKDFGAVDNNVKEKDINLGVAKKLASKIKKGCKDVNVVMTRDNDSFITLQDRANIANDNKGNLFISIHTNSVDKSNPRRTSVAGASVYALGLHKDKNNLQVAMRENSVIELEKNFEQKYSGFDPSKDESYIIFEMAQKKNLGQSLKFADMAQKNLVNVAGRGDRGVKQAGFWVLWATSMPAVLVELDFICNPNCAVFMGSEKGQEQMADALYKAFEKYHSSVKGQINSPRAEEIQVKNMDSSAHATPVMASAQPVEKQIVESQSTNKQNSSLKRRRRSDASKKISDSRNVETASIPLHTEAERLPVIEKFEDQPVMASAQTDQPATTKNKKEKKKKNETSKKNKNNTTATYNNKTVVVNKDIAEQSGESNKSSSSNLKHHKSISGYHSKVEKLKTIYKIQILASADLLKQNSPQFHGLSPVKSFKEHNLYKYTYGESESRQEMESLLKKVKQVIPDAFIIKSMK